MRVLLDTHVFLWAVSASPRLKIEARRLIEAAEVVYVSAASIWEIAIKRRLGRISVDPEELVAAITESGFTELPVVAAHAARVAGLDLIHNDPFDRLLVAQALVEPVRLLTADAPLRQYSELVTVV
jgi:PIN domain nuclease of toxin-antitoxin system